MNAIDVVIMAAGQGTRMKSRVPKVLHRLAGRPLLQHVFDAVSQLQARHIVVVTGNGAAQVEAAVAGWARSGGKPAPQFARQEPQLGTGHAVQQAAPLLPDDGTTLILNGDVPLIEPATLRALVESSGAHKLALLTVDMPDPSGYGRILRSGDAVHAIVEHKDASGEQRLISEVYTGFMAVPNALLKRWLARLSNKNAQGEYYLTDVVELAVRDGVEVAAVKASDKVQVEGVNSPLQLAALERAFQLRQANALMRQGVRIADPARFDVRGQVECGQDVEIDVNCVFQGRVSLGDGVTIGANCVIANASISAGAVIHPFTHIDGEKLG
ncbi:MAG TPA: bifunctional UDP-N-acetylglucosamine diphosphorylase/glucosamine-1-phosphate N-acetyltransferase GlmU, partial [Ramlibacter sp.]|nr:bifunctional UDP-N-acetylglucosamine diphosphorylase/glucosamine-1-phosphate N-acetyltransferase GlmU [Ramlibacter sp.]